MDGTGADAVAARRQLAGLGELVAAVRLPNTAHRRTAGTDVVTDVLVIRRFGDGEQPPAGEPAWIQTVPVDVGGAQIPVNRHFADHPGMVLGELAAGGPRRADDLQVIAPAGTDVAAGLAQALAGQPPAAQRRRRGPATPAPVTGRRPRIPASPPGRHVHLDHRRVLRALRPARRAGRAGGTAGAARHPGRGDGTAGR